MSGKRDYDGQKEYLLSLGVSNLNEYCLINNFGYTFDINNIHYDLRYWANCYGCCLNYWDIGSKDDIAVKIVTYFNSYFV